MDGIFFYGMIVALPPKPGQRKRIPRQFAFYHNLATFSDGMILMFVLLPCNRDAKCTQFRPRNHHRIFFDRIIVRLVLLAC